CALSTASAATATTPASSAATETWIRRRMHDQPIDEEVDRMRHDLDGVERGVIECVSGALDQRERRRHSGGVELTEEIDAGRHWHRRVGRTVNKDRRREGFANVFSG